MGNTATLLTIDFGEECYEEFGQFSRYEIWHIYNYQVLPEEFTLSWLEGDCDKALAKTDTAQSATLLVNTLYNHSQLYSNSKSEPIWYDMVNRKYHIGENTLLST